MLKQYFTDGLVQIAIVLSLLRTDLNNYINQNYVNYPEVQEIILGQTAAYTQANFHNSYNTHLGSPEIYRKNIELYEPVLDSSILREIRSFRHLSDIGDREFQAFLLVAGGSTGSSTSGFYSDDTDGSEQSTDSNDENNNNVEHSGQDELTIEELEQEGQNLLNTLEETIGAIARQGTDPTNEDLDLIEVLWRQDIDLGVGKEVFDPNLRRELEREREIELQKERQKQKDQECLQKKLEEQRMLAEQRWLNDNFTQDGETGEWVPMGGNRVPPPPPAPDLANMPEQEQFLSSFDNMPALSSEIQAEQGSSYNQMPPQYQGPQPIHPQTSQMYSPNAGQYGLNTSSTSSYPAQQQQQHNLCPNMTNLNNRPHYQQGPQPQAFNNTPANFNHSQQQQNYNHMQAVPQSHHQHHQQQHQQAPPQYPRQASLDATWQDLINILDLPNNNTRTTANNSTSTRTTNTSISTNTSSPSTSSSSLATGSPVQPNQVAMSNMVSSSPAGPQMNGSGGMGGGVGVAGLDNSSSVLLQNVSMPTPAPVNGNMSFNGSGMVSQSHRTPPHSTGLMSPVGNFNSSMPSGSDPSSLGPLDWENQDFIFPNISGLGGAGGAAGDGPGTPGGLEDVDELLPDLITEEELEEINLGNMELSDHVSPPPSNGGGDDASSDSAVSMGSQSAGSPEQDEFSEDALSPYDGLEGATGGGDGSQFPKTSKYDPDDYKYSNSCSYSCGDSNSSNFSSSSNESGSDGYGRSNGHGGGGHFSHNSNGHHLNHNHTYPLKPGQDPKDYRKHILHGKEPRHKGPVSKDSKRIEELKVPFTLEQIVHSPVEEFNDMLTRHKLDEPQLQLIRDIRRRGKNKVAAQNCRKRKINVIETLSDDMSSMEKMRDKLVQERHIIDKQTMEMKEKLRCMYAEIFHSLRDESGQPYDPARFSLQQSSDGDVFLVPRNYTTDEDLNKRRKNGDGKQ